MMSPSPFDEALSTPFIQESHTTKKWSIMSSTSEEKERVAEELDEMMKDVDIEACPLIEMETILFDDALVQERHNELFDINKDLHCINSIHKDLADLVEYQDEDIKKMSWFAIESFENTESGLEQVVRAAKFTDNYQQSQRRKHVLFLLLGLVVVLGFSRALMGEDGSPAGADSIHPDSALHAPIIHIHAP